MTDLHVVPSNDWIRHEDCGGCVCGPRLELIRHPSGAVRWAYIHPSLDGREQQKTPPAS